MTGTVLLVEDDRAVREALGQTLDLAGLKPVLAGSYIEAKDHVTPGFAGVIVSDIRMSGKDGFALLEYARRVDADLPVILLTGHADVPMAVRAMAAGAFGFLEKPCAAGDLLEVITRALAHRAGVLADRQARRNLQSRDAATRIIFGTSALAEDLRDSIRVVARTPGSVLITGDPGTGIYKVAEVIHLMSANAARPFQKFAAASLDAAGLRQAFAQSDGGTIFLDEVGQLGQPAQFALLDLLDDTPSVRMLAGTHRALRAEVERAEAERRGPAFLPDLYYKLDVMRVRIPSLRERPEDIPEIYRLYLAQACEQAALPMPVVSAGRIAHLMAQDWPGNARALMNAAMRHALGLDEAEEAGNPGLAERMANVERSLLVEALRRWAGNATEAAAALKLPRKTFYDKLARHDLRCEDYRG